VTLTRLVLGVAALVLAGCATLWPPILLLDRADRLAARGDYGGAVRTYDELLAKYPQDHRAQARRDTLAGLLAARADLARVREELAAREIELSRLRQEMQRLLAETERLRGDIEELKKIDLRQEERRRR
jgi:predicted nuclease with TOPRIM domain